MARLELKGVRKTFQNLEVVHGIDLEVEDGSFTVLVGPSGCGKSTLLRMIAGLEEVTAGEIWLDETRCDHILPSARGMAMVFQSYALYPHMSVRENLRFGLVCQKLPKSEIDARVKHAAQLLEITNLLERRPGQLSGGQSQRVAIGRAIVKEPKAFLFDEPLSNLDAELRVRMRSEIAALHRRLGATMVYVTHDQVEAMTMADKIVVLRDGMTEQVGSPLELYARPANAFVAGFLGAPRMNMFEATVTRIEPTGLALALPDGSGIQASVAASSIAVGDRVTVGIRPEHLVVSDDGPVSARVMSSEILGAETLVFMKLPTGAPLTASLRGIYRLTEGSLIRLAFDPRFVHVFDETGRTLSPVRDWQVDYVSGEIASSKVVAGVLHEAAQ